jgi:hypothetical protein
MERELKVIIGQTTQDLIDCLKTLSNQNINYQFTNFNKPRKRNKNNNNGRKRK